VTTPKCEICNDLHFVVVEGKRKSCICLVKVKVRNYLRNLGRQLLPDPKVLQMIDHLRPDRDIHILWNQKDEQLINGMLAMLLLKGGSTKTYSVQQAYGLIEIFLGNNADYKTIFNITEDVCILKGGYCEFPNKQQEKATARIIASPKAVRPVNNLHVTCTNSVQSILSKPFYNPVPNEYTKQGGHYQNCKYRQRTEDKDYNY